ncbi:hypothetical protein pb186bvf_015121 [Paramecium bursaria]
MMQGFQELEIDSTLEPLFQKMQSQVASEQLKQQTEDQILFFKEVSNKPCFLDHYRNLRNNQFAEAIRLSYQYHVPLILSPDDLWLVISQGFGIHVNMNAEQLRKQFVDFDGKKKLTIFVQSVQSIVWPKIFKKFSDLIKENVGDSFTINNPIFQAVQEIQLIDSLQCYFIYGVACMCGITKVRFLGTLDDWLRLRDATLQLAQFDLDWWISKLQPLLDKLIEEYQADKGDKFFWNSIYQIRNGKGSGSPPQTATGWITLFYPYTKIQETFTKQHLQNLNEIGKGKDSGFNPKSIPSGLSNVPIELNDNGIKYDLTAKAGFTKVTYEDGFIRLEIGYLIIGKLQNKEENEKQAKSKIKQKQNDS